MDEDSDFFLKNVPGIPKGDNEIELNKQKVRSKNVDDPYWYLEKYCEIDESVIRVIEGYYELDFRLFGYEKFVRGDFC